MGSPVAATGIRSTNVDPVDLATAFRALVPAISRKVVAEIQREIPDRVRPYGTHYSEALEQAVVCAISHFIDLIPAQAAGTLQHRRQMLLDALIADAAPATEVIQDMAREANWMLPRSAAAVVLRRRDGRPPHRPALPEEILVGLDRPEPCLIVPDPDGPGRQQLLETALSDWIAAVGPSVPVTELAKSLSWARCALDFAQQGLIPGRELVCVTEHMPTLLILQQLEFVEGIAERTLAPLMKARPRQQYVLAQTLQVLLASGFQTTYAAAQLHLHAQTIRYRIRQLESLFGETMYDPSRRLELQIVLHAWLAVTTAQDNPKAESTPPRPPAKAASVVRRSTSIAGW
jgi:hypothetical protein